MFCRGEQHLFEGKALNILCNTCHNIIWASEQPLLYPMSCRPQTDKQRSKITATCINKIQRAILQVHQNNENAIIDTAVQCMFPEPDFFQIPRTVLGRIQRRRPTAYIFENIDRVSRKKKTKTTTKTSPVLAQKIHVGISGRITKTRQPTITCYHDKYYFLRE